MKAIRTYTLLLGAMLALGGCGSTPTSNAPLRSTSAQTVDAKSQKGLRVALKSYLTALYKRLDVNGDQKLSFEEASAFFSKDEFANLNLNGNPNLTLKEMLDNEAFMARASAKLHEQASVLMAQLDVNRDARLSWEEYEVSLQASGDLTPNERLYAQVAFNMADRNHDGLLTLSDFEDMMSLAMVQSQAATPNLQEIFDKCNDYVTAKYGPGLVPMGATISWIDANGAFTRTEGSLVFSYWSPLTTKSNTYCEVTVRYRSARFDSVRNTGAQHVLSGDVSGIDLAQMLTPTQVLASANKAGLPTGESYFVQFIGASNGLAARAYVDAYQLQGDLDVRLGGLTLDAKTGNALSPSSR